MKSIKTINLFATILLIAFVNASIVSAQPVVVIVNKVNSVNSLSKQEVQRFFLTKSKSWPAGKKVNPLHQIDGSAAKKGFLTSVLNMNRLDYQKYWLEKKQRSGESEPRAVKSERLMLLFVGAGAESVGYLSKEFYANLKRDDLKKVKVVFPKVGF